MTVKIDENELLEAKEKSVKVGAELKKVRGFALGFIIPIVLLVVWEAAVRFNLLDAYVFPAPTTILQKIIELAKEGTLWACRHYILSRIDWISSRNSSRGSIGSVVGYFKWFEQLMDPLIQAFRSIPSLAWVPLFIFVDGNWRSFESNVDCCWCVFPNLFKYRFRHSRG